MSRRATSLAGLAALAAEVILVIAMTTEGKTVPSAEPKSQLDGDPGQLHGFCP